MVNFFPFHSGALKSIDLIVLVGLSRMDLGVHYLTDVIAAVAASTAWLALCLTSVDELRRRRAGRRLLT